MYVLRFHTETQMVTEDVDFEDLFTLVNDFIVADRMFFLVDCHKQQICQKYWRQNYVLISSSISC